MTTVKTDLNRADEAGKVPFAPSTSIPKTDVQRAVEAVSAASAPVGAQYVVAAADATLTAERVLTDTATVSWDAATSGQMKANIADAELLAVAGLTSAADKLPYFTGSGTASLADCTAFARTVLDDADAATARATLGLTIGSDVQAYDAELAAIAGLTSAGNKFPYFTGSGSAALADLTAFARSILDDANEAAFKATVNLEIGTDVQAHDADLDAIAALSPADGNIIVGDGATWVAESGATARTSLGVGSGDSPQITGIELGHASDTTITRVSAGDVAVEGNLIYRAGQTGGISQNYISQLTVYSNTASKLGIADGTEAAPSTGNDDPVFWAQKITRFDNGTDRFAQNIGGAYGEVVVLGQGSAGATNVDGTWIGVGGTSVIKGANYGTPTVQDWDAYGSAIGVAGFAEVEGYPGNGGIVTALWGYAATPTLDDTTFDNLPVDETFSTVGLEVNVKYNHKDPGVRAFVAGHGNTVGIYVFNYRTAGDGVRDWTFGIAFAGNPNDDNYTSTDIDNWNGFHTGILLDKIKNYGILFGQLLKTGSYGIKFPDSFIGSQDPAAGVHMGGTKLNMGQYLGSTFNNGDMWANGDARTPYYKANGSNYSVGLVGAAYTPAATTADTKIPILIGTTTYYLLASTSGT